MLSGPALADEWFRFDSRFNGKHAQLVLDTGAGTAVVFRHAAERLGLSYHDDPDASNERVHFWITEECEVKLRLGFWNTARVKGPWHVVELPKYVQRHMQLDGVLGWPCIKENILELDAGRRKFRFLGKVPEKAKQWTMLNVQTDPVGGILTLDLPTGDGITNVLLVDSGARGQGISLSPRYWQEWKTGHGTQALTMTARYSPAPGIFAVEQGWAKEMLLGPMVLHGVTVELADPVMSLRTNYAGTIGFGALNRLGFIIDGKNHVAYIRPKTNGVSPGRHNRLGAEFVPPDAKSDDLVAHVAESSPAAEAGIRGGDVLLKIDDKDVTGWREQTDADVENDFERKPGTMLRLTLKRGEQVMIKSAILRDILK